MAAAVVAEQDLSHGFACDLRELVVVQRRPALHCGSVIDHAAQATQAAVPAVLVIEGARALTAGSTAEMT